MDSCWSRSERGRRLLKLVGSEPAPSVLGYYCSSEGCRSSSSGERGVEDGSDEKGRRLPPPHTCCVTASRADECAGMLIIRMKSAPSSGGR